MAASWRSRRTLIVAPMVAVVIALVIAAGIVIARRDSGEQLPKPTNHLVMWTSCQSILEQSDAQLATWSARGVGGFVCGTGHLDGAGGEARFTADAAADLTQPGYELQRALTESRLVPRLHALDMKLYLGFNAVNFFNVATPFSRWFDDEGWARSTIPAVQRLAAAAHQLGADGLAVDQELYPQQGAATSANWGWQVVAAGRTEGDVRAKVRQRGSELQAAVNSVFPGVEYSVYDFHAPGSFNEALQRCVNNLVDTYRDDVRIDFWDGVAGVDGYERIRFFDATFYKGTLRDLTWDTALRYNAARIYATLSQRWESWSRAAPRVAVSPFAWIDGDEANEGPFTAPRPPDYVADQLAAFRRWGVDGQFAVFAYAGLDGFDYSPYADGMRLAGLPATSVPVAPTIALDGPADRATPDASVEVSGSVTDQFAVRYISWRTNRGAAGMAKLSFPTNSDCRSWPDGPTAFSIGSIPLRKGANTVTITAVDTEGGRASVTVSIRRE